MYREQIENINKNVSKNLVPLARSTTRRYIRIPITARFHHYLRFQIKLTGRFKACPLMIDAFQIPTNRQIEANKICIATNFQAKVANSKTHDGYRGMRTLTIRFIRHDDFIIESDSLQFFSFCFSNISMYDALPFCCIVLICIVFCWNVK